MINLTISLSVIVRIIAIFVSIIIISDCIKDIIDAKNHVGLYYDESRFYVVRGVIISSIIIAFLILVILVSAGMINITWLGV
jgi:hypothetical protein